MKLIFKHVGSIRPLKTKLFTDDNMKILAIEKELKSVNWADEAQTLTDEARSVYQLMLAGELREIYFTAKKNAVLMLECDNMESAERLLGEMPLVKKGIIGFEL